MDLYQVHGISKAGESGGKSAEKIRGAGGSAPRRSTPPAPQHSDSSQHSSPSHFFEDSRFSWWTFQIFLIFFCLGRGKGESEAPGGGGGVGFLLKTEGEGARGWEGVCGELGNVGGWLNIFFGAEVSTKFSIP